MDNEDKKSNRFFNKLTELLLENLMKQGVVELEDVIIEADKLELWFQSVVPPVVKEKIPPPIVKPIEITEIEFIHPQPEWMGRIAEVRLGATKSEGGTRDRSFIIGGETLPPFYLFQGVMPHPPVIAMDVFDMRVPLPKAIKMHFNEVMDDSAEWAKRCVETYNAEMINLHLASTDPYIKDTPPFQAAKTIEEVLQAVKVPICVGGSGNAEKDSDVFLRIAEVSEGENVLINSLNLDMGAKLEEVAKKIREHGHTIIAFSPMDLDKARELNRKLYDFVEKERIIMDTNTAGIGYGLEYGFTAMERARFYALKGDEDLQHPIAAGVTNAWVAREAWMKMDPYWGPGEIRGPIWETITALANLLAGADYFMMMHPTSIKTIHEVINYLLKGNVGKVEDIYSWVSAKLR